MNKLYEICPQKGLISFSFCNEFKSINQFQNANLLFFFQISKLLKGNLMQLVRNVRKTSKSYAKPLSHLLYLLSLSEKKCVSSHPNRYRRISQYTK